MAAILWRIVGQGAARGPRPPRQAKEHETAVHVHAERRINAPLEHVFEVVRDIEWLPGWNPYMEMRGVNGPLDRVGTSFETSIRMLGLQFSGRGTIVAAEPQRLIHIRADCTHYGGTSEWIYRFAPAEESTCCSVDINCEASGVLAMLDKLFGRPALQAALERMAQQLLVNLASLAKHNEAD
jgi:carbon monoxide dehydrogenase subunit G